MKRRLILKTLLSAVMAIAGTVALLPGAAQAVYLCGPSELCFYKDPDARGTVSVQARLIPGRPGYTGVIEDFRNSHYSDGSGLNDSISSVVNYTDSWVILYVDGHRGGAQVFIRPFRGMVNLNNVPRYTFGSYLGYGSMDNLATSAQVGSCSNCFELHYP